MAITDESRSECYRQNRKYTRVNFHNFSSNANVLNLLIALTIGTMLGEILLVMCLSLIILCFWGKKAIAKNKS